MMDFCPIINATMELKDCADRWFIDEKYDCWCLEDVLYTPAATAPLFQRLSIFVPRAYMSAPGVINHAAAFGRYTADTAPIVFENNAAGYMQMPHTWLGGPRNYAEQYLRHGLIYVTSGCRGRETPEGKAPATLVDLKTAIRFLRHNRAALPGCFDRVISVGWSAGGAMSSLLAVTGDNAAYLPLLEKNGAFMDESDAVYAAQIYCPIIDLEHADLAYEWCFAADRDCENSPAGPAETMTPFKEALSAELSRRYVGYINAMGLKDPETGAPLTLTEDGRGGSFYDYQMACLNKAAAKFLSLLGQADAPLKCSPEDYLAGHYTRLTEAPREHHDGPPAMHHAGPGVVLPTEQPRRPMGLGEMMLRPPKGTPFHEMKPEMVEVPGTAKPWLTWDGREARISNLDEYVLNHRRRMKPCTSFDKLTNDSGENEEFGNVEQGFVHFDPIIGEAIAAIADRFPEEAARYQAAYEGCMSPELAERVRLLNPLSFIGTGEKSNQAKHYRIRVGASDADTSLSVAMTLALRLQNAGCGSVDYALVWDQPHSEADYPGEVLDWIDGIC